MLPVLLGLLLARAEPSFERVSMKRGHCGITQADSGDCALDRSSGSFPERMWRSAVRPDDFEEKRLASLSTACMHLCSRMRPPVQQGTARDRSCHARRCGSASLLPTSLRARARRVSCTAARSCMAFARPAEAASAASCMSGCCARYFASQRRTSSRTGLQSPASSAHWGRRGLARAPANLC